MKYDDQIAGGPGVLYWIADPKKRFQFDPFTPGDEDKARAAARAHRDAETARRESIAGRRLSLDELRRGSVDRVETRNAVQREIDAKWQPELRPGGRYDALIESLEPEAKNKAFTPGMHVDPKRLYESAKMLRDAAEDDAERDAALAAHLAEPRTAAALAELNKLRDAYQWDPTVSQSEWEAVNRAIAQVSHPQGDTSVSRSMLKDILGREDARVAEQTSAAEATLAQAQARVAALQAGVKPGRVQVTEGSNLEHTGVNLFNAMDAAGHGFAALDRVHSALEKLRTSGDGSAVTAVLSEFAEGGADAVPSQG